MQTVNKFSHVLTNYSFYSVDFTFSDSFISKWNYVFVCHRKNTVD